MGYSYAKEKPWVFTEAGQRQFLKVRDFADHAVKISGAIRADKLIAAAGGGDSWKMMACIDRLVEIEELREIGSETPWQWRIFVSKREQSQ